MRRTSDRATATAASRCSLNPADASIPGATTGNTDARRQFAADGIGTVNLQEQDRKSNYNGMQLDADRSATRAASRSAATTRCRRSKATSPANGS